MHEKLLLKKNVFYVSNVHFRSRLDARDHTFIANLFVSLNITMFMTFLTIFDSIIWQSLKIRSNLDRSSAYYRYNIDEQETLRPSSVGPSVTCGRVCGSFPAYHDQHLKAAIFFYLDKLALILAGKYLNAAIFFSSDDFALSLAGKFLVTRGSRSK